MINKVVVFITALNEEEVIGDILSDIDASYDIYLIDDGSSDSTAEIARGYRAHVISHPINLGQGMAVITAFKVLSEKDYDIVIEMDGDGQHDPKEIPKFIKKMEETGADIVAGSRILGINYETAPLSRRITLVPLGSVLRKLTGYNITDFMCGFRAFRGGALRKVAPTFDDMLETEYLASEMWIKFAKAGLTVAEVPIMLSERKHGSSRKGHAFLRYGFGIIKTIIRTKLDTYKMGD